MDQLFLTVSLWSWLGFAALMFIVEILTGTGFLLWTGISAIVLAVLLFIFPALPWGMQWLIFSGLSVFSVLLWKAYLYYHPVKPSHVVLNRRAEQYIGRVFTIQTPIVNGRGEIHVDDTIWRVSCNQDLPNGAQITVIGTEGILLVVVASAE